MTDCNDTLEYKNSNNLIGTNGFAYSPTIQLYQLDAIQQDFVKNYVAAASTPVNSFVGAYGQETFNESLISFNNFLYSSNMNFNLTDTYPLVKERLDRGVAITQIEFSMFMEESSYNPITIQSQQTSNPKNVLFLYNTYLNGTFSKSTMGSFCELAPAIFGAVANFFTSVRNLANKITDIINSIQNFSLASLLDNLKTKIMDVVENTINKVKKIVENFTLQGIMSASQQFFHSQILYKFNQLKEQALSFFDESNVNGFKQRIEGLISYAASVFKNPSIEEIQFLIYRFCTFITQVENIINSIKNPLDDFSNRYVYAGKILKSRSDLNTLSAVMAGAKRFNDNEVSSGVSSAATAEVDIGNQPPPTPAEIEGLPKWNDGKGDSRITFTGRWTSPPPASVSNGSIVGGMGSEGWYGADTKARVLLLRVQQEFARSYGINQLIINSAYRSPEYNELLRSVGTNAAKNSLHTKRIAFDVKWAGYPKYREEFISIAKKHGFKGIGRYSGGANFTHIDLGNSREWTG